MFKPEPFLRTISAYLYLGQTVTDWPTYNRDLAATRYSPLTQINPGNVASLAVTWSYKMRPDANSHPASGTMNQVTPIVVNGMMYLPCGKQESWRSIPRSGKELWRYDLKAGTVASQRGVASWPGGQNRPPMRILFR